MNVFGPRIRVRPTRHDDLPFLQALWNDGSVMRHLGYPHGMHVTDAGMERWWGMTPQAQQPNTRFSSLATPHCVVELLDGTPIGELTYSFDTNQRARLDLKLAVSHWGQGLATEAMALVLREIFATTRVDRVVVEPATANVAAHRLARRLGFRPAPTENHPDRWACTRTDFANRDPERLAEVA